MRAPNDAPAGAGTVMVGTDLDARARTAPRDGQRSSAPGASAAPADAQFSAGQERTPTLVELAGFVVVTRWSRGLSLEAAAARWAAHTGQRPLLLLVLLDEIERGVCSEAARLVPQIARALGAPLPDAASAVLLRR
jgi:hypothetical protein